MCVLRQEVIIHPAYDEWTLRNDIALLRIEPITEFTDSVQPVCMPTESFEEYEGETVIVSGWGTLEDGDIYYYMIIYFMVDVIFIAAKTLGKLQGYPNVKCTLTQKNT